MMAEVAETWERVYAESKQHSQWPWSKLVSYIKRYNPRASLRNQRVLELGCGVGANVPFFEVENALYYGIDISEVAVATVKKVFPNVANRVHHAALDQPFTWSEFDLIFDRAATPHNSWSTVQKIVAQVRKHLKPGGIFIGVDWFSSKNGYASLGQGITGDTATRLDLPPGPYQGLEPIRFFSKKEIEELFKGFEFLMLLEETTAFSIPSNMPSVSSWDFVVRR